MGETTVIIFMLNLHLQEWYRAPNCQHTNEALWKNHKHADVACFQDYRKVQEHMANKKSSKTWKSSVKGKFGKWLGHDNVFFDKPQFTKTGRNSGITKLLSLIPATAFVSV